MNTLRCGTLDLADENLELEGEGGEGEGEGEEDGAAGGIGGR